MLTVYGRRSSSSVQLVMWAISELEIEYKRLDFGHGYTSTMTEDYLSKNPMGLIPVIEDESLIMFESAAILRYLSAKYGDNHFWPEDLSIRGPLDTWAEWGKNTFTNAVLNIFVYDVRLSPKTRDPQIIKNAINEINPLAKILDSKVNKSKWIGGEHFSFADIACGHILYRYYSLDWKRPNLSALLSYYERLKERQGFREHVMVSYEELRGSY